MPNKYLEKVASTRFVRETLSKLTNSSPKSLVGKKGALKQYGKDKGIIKNPEDTPVFHSENRHHTANVIRKTEIAQGQIKDLSYQGRVEMTGYDNKAHVLRDYKHRIKGTLGTNKNSLSGTKTKLPKDLPKK